MSGHIAFDYSVNRKLASASSAAKFIDPIERLCNQDICPYRRDGEFLIFDYGHFSAYGSKLAVASYFPYFLDRC